ncbi:DUF4376 domain-containing protein [Halomonas koreensis]|uniref:DUF4376 domain-containing protein n=1 Tax=Halomonas koreensis TaxID=245385 RepID=A0ABU1G6F1_9GAMM|nr:tail fiber assembly protein [Halomonas koreensis]MDR5868098.1 DUF4376 domain-containing protein [Halomonas koreensis]
MHYSAANNAFYDERRRKAYDAAGNWPDDAVKVSDADYQAYKGTPPAGMRRGADADGHPAWIEIPPPGINALVARQRSAIATALADALAAGMPYTMPDGTEDTVQMLAEDRQNLLGLAIEARDLKAAGETGAVQEFRGLSNTRYPMTPDETIALTDAALAHYKALLQRSWDRKDEIDQAFEKGDISTIKKISW